MAEALTANMYSIGRRWKGSQTQSRDPSDPAVATVSMILGHEPWQNPCSQPMEQVDNKAEVSGDTIRGQRSIMPSPHVHLRSLQLSVPQHQNAGPIPKRPNGLHLRGNDLYAMYQAMAPLPASRLFCRRPIPHLSHGTFQVCSFIWHEADH